MLQEKLLRVRTTTAIRHQQGQEDLLSGVDWGVGCRRGLSLRTLLWRTDGRKCPGLLLMHRAILLLHWSLLAVLVLMTALGRANEHPGPRRRHVSVGDRGRRRPRVLLLLAVVGGTRNDCSSAAAAGVVVPRRGGALPWLLLLLDKLLKVADAELLKFPGLTDKGEEFRWRLLRLVLHPLDLDLLLLRMVLLVVVRHVDVVMVVVLMLPRGAATG